MMLLLSSTIVLLSSTIVLLPTSMLPTGVLAAMLLSPMLSWVATITGCLWWRWHMIYATALQVDKDSALVFLGAVLQS